ncbi:MAG: hypothetical protein WC438_06195 [Candidatus Pacearchaeota archaeon]
MKIYNKNAPSSYNKYWNIEDNEPKLKEMAEEILLNYIQSWGQSETKRLECLAKIANEIGFKVNVIKQENETFGFAIIDKVEKFRDFREKIRNIHRGNFESEIVQISEIIQEFAKKNKKWWEFWK